MNGIFMVYDDEHWAFIGIDEWGGLVAHNHRPTGPCPGRMKDDINAQDVLISCLYSQDGKT